MKALFLFFNSNGTIKTGNIRVNGKKVPDMATWEVYDFYTILTSLGYEPIEMDAPDGGYVHMIIY